MIVTTWVPGKNNDGDWFNPNCWSEGAPTAETIVADNSSQYGQWATVSGLGANAQAYDLYVTGNGAVAARNGSSITVDNNAYIGPQAQLAVYSSSFSPVHLDDTGYILDQGTIVASSTLINGTGKIVTQSGGTITTTTLSNNVHQGIYFNYSGTLAVASGTNNNGSIVVRGAASAATFYGSVSGNGVIDIGDGAKVTCRNSVSNLQTIYFFPDGTNPSQGSLELLHATEFHGTIAGVSPESPVICDDFLYSLTTHHFSGSTLTLTSGMNSAHLNFAAGSLPSVIAGPGGHVEIV